MQETPNFLLGRGDRGKERGLSKRAKNKKTFEKKAECNRGLTGKVRKVNVKD